MIFLSIACKQNSVEMSAYTPTVESVNNASRGKKGKELRGEVAEPGLRRLTRKRTTTKGRALSKDAGLASSAFTRQHRDQVL